MQCTLTKYEYKLYCLNSDVYNRAEGQSGAGTSNEIGFSYVYYKGVQEWHTKVIKNVYMPSAPIRNVSAVIFWECFHNVNDFWDASRKESL